MINGKKEKKGLLNLGMMLAQVSLISPTAASALRIAFSAVYGSASVWFEGDFAFFSAFSTDCLVQFSSLHSISTPILI